MSRLSDPEVSFILGCWMVHFEGPPQALGYLKQTVAGGFSAADTLARERLFDPMREEPAFSDLLERAEAGRDATRDVFCEAGAEALLGIRV